MFGDLIAVESDGGIFGKLISKFTNSNIVHVGMMLYGNEFIEATLKGIRISTLDKLKKKNYWICRLSNNYSDEILSNERAVMAFVRNRIGEPYDFLQIIKFIPFILSSGLYTPKENNELYVCSELVSSIWERFGVLSVDDIGYLFRNNIDVNTSTITPTDLFNLNIYKEKEFKKKRSTNVT